MKNKEINYKILEAENEFKVVEQLKVSLKKKFSKGSFEGLFVYLSDIDGQNEVYTLGEVEISQLVEVLLGLQEEQDDEVFYIEDEVIGEDDEDDPILH